MAGSPIQAQSFADFSGGLNLTQAELADNETPESRNWTINETGSLLKRLGSTWLASPAIAFDTETTYKTKKEERKALGKLPGKFIKAEWVNAAVSRTRLIEAAAQNGYLLIFDGDEELAGEAIDVYAQAAMLTPYRNTAHVHREAKNNIRGLRGYGYQITET